MKKLHGLPLFLALFLFSCLAHADPKDDARAALSAEKLEGKVLQVHFLNIGEGDSILIRTPGGKSYLIDAGPRSAKKIIPPYLKSIGVEKLDGVIISHSHMDHIGGIPTVLDAFPVGTVYSSGRFHEAFFTQELLEQIEKKGIKMVRLRAGDTVDVEPEIKVSVLNPPKDWPEDKGSLNNYSVVVRLSYGDVDFMLVGDAEVRAEKEILKLAGPFESEFLKVGHHGSESSTGDAFLAAVKPLWAVISVREPNKFEHPHAPTLNKLKAGNITILRTDKDGTIVVTTDGKKVQIKTTPKEEGKPVSILIPAGPWVVGLVKSV